MSATAISCRVTITVDSCGRYIVHENEQVPAPQITTPLITLVDTEREPGHFDMKHETPTEVTP